MFSNVKIKECIFIGMIGMTTVIFAHENEMNNRSDIYFNCFRRSRFHPGCLNRDANSSYLRTENRSPLMKMAPIPKQTICLEILLGTTCSYLFGIIGARIAYSTGPKELDFMYGTLLAGYLVGSVTGSTLGVYWAGRCGGIKSSLLSAFGGSLLGGCGSLIFGIYGLLVSPLLQTIVGTMLFNATRKGEMETNGESVVTFHKGQWKLYLPRFALKANPYLYGDWIKELNLVSINF